MTAATWQERGTFVVFLDDDGNDVLAVPATSVRSIAPGTTTPPTEVPERIRPVRRLI
ncbi:hypothetical protein [Arsenicicoccus dermatophilus]|uniref:hypothetical protein n=1 Tax=Arsenicicoccus dermatophilus TaxID=1076331 RepID=UPI001F4D0812|nr:hypothetical protein [Arsenicicoccus dermatophilus]MCH8611776.1 hypothetical protein [Arsenicicoccus dermatophilus]